MHARTDTPFPSSGSDSPSSVLADAIDAILPQTQCTRCGYDACRPYADAIARGEAEINRCPPGGEAGIRALARLTGRPVLPLDSRCGAEGPRRVARVDESRCIGCTICIQKCPVDAIVGAPKQMHTVLAALCTGCDLCVAPCPVDCIEMVSPQDAESGWNGAQRDRARARFARRNERLAREAALRLAHRADGAPARVREPGAERLAVIRGAVQRARAKRASRVPLEAANECAGTPTQGDSRNPSA
jgi:electron transport complex protein RnfB